MRIFFGIIWVSFLWGMLGLLLLASNSEVPEWGARVLVVVGAMSMFLYLALGEMK